MHLITVRILFIFVYICLFSYTHAYMASFWCWQASYTVSCQQGGGSTRPYFLWFHSSIFSVFYFHIFCFLFFFSHTPLSFERESRQKRFSYSATREAAKWGSVKTVPGSRFSCNRRVFLRRPLLGAASFSLKHVQPFPINGCTGGSYRRLMCLYMRNGSCQ